MAPFGMADVFACWWCAMNEGDGILTSELLDRLARSVAELPVERIPALVAALSAITGAAVARILESPPAEGSCSDHPDENLSIEEAAHRLGVSKDYLYRHAKRLPFARRIGRRLLFSARGLERWNARLR